MRRERSALAAGTVLKAGVPTGSRFKGYDDIFIQFDESHPPPNTSKATSFPPAGYYDGITEQPGCFTEEFCLQCLHESGAAITCDVNRWAWITSDKLTFHTLHSAASSLRY
jgi:hypothetical protein